MSKRNAAVKLAEKGFKIFLLGLDSKIPAIPVVIGKAINDPEKVYDMWTGTFRESRDNNIGVNTDELFILDFDSSAGRELVDHEFKTYHAAYKFKHVAETTSGGYHVYYRLPPGVRCKSSSKSSKKFGDTIDSKSWHSYVVGPGSDIDGAYYKWLESVPDGHEIPSSIEDLEVCPQEFIDACGAPAERAGWVLNIDWDTPAAISQAKDYLINRAPVAIQGQGGDQTTYSVACQVREFAVSDSYCLELMLDNWNETKAVPPWSLEELDKKIENAYQYAKRSPHVLGSEFEAVSFALPESKGDWLAPQEVAPGHFAGLPPRYWVIPDLIAKAYAFEVVAPSGAGKTQLFTQMAIAVATNRPDIVGVPSLKRGKVWYWNQEDDLNEIRRRMLAATTHFGIKGEEFAGRLFLNSGVEKPLILVERSSDRRLLPSKSIERIIHHIIKNEIDVFIADPLIEFHEVDENDNVQMRIVGSALRRIAIEANCAVIYGHHTKKPPGASSDGFAGNADAGRGASSVTGTTRGTHTLFAITTKDAKKLGVKEEERHLFLRWDGAKTNIAPPDSTARPKGFRRQSVLLPNGEWVGVLVPIEFQRVESRVKKEREDGRSDFAEIIAEVMAEKMLTSTRWPALKQEVATRMQITLDQLEVLTTKATGQLMSVKQDRYVEIISEKGRGGCRVKLHDNAIAGVPRGEIGNAEINADVLNTKIPDSGGSVTLALPT